MRREGGNIVDMVHVRRARDEDASFLAEMLLAAADWRLDAPVRSVGDIMSLPPLAHYVADWARPGDLGIIAEADGPIGAAWWRYFDADDPGYGFVDQATPEISVGVRHPWRRQGVGTRLLCALAECAHAEGVAALSLSVEPDNHAVRLYERLGFEVVARPGGSLTMLLRL